MMVTNKMAHFQNLKGYVDVLSLGHVLTRFSSSLDAEVSRVPGRKETLRVPPSETVTYQTPDHRL